MRRTWCVSVGLVALATLAGCKPGWFETRAPWRREAEEQCLKSGAVKESAAVSMLRPIEGPGICGADFPLKVAALGESEAMGYADELRPPGLVPQGASAPATPYGNGGLSPPSPAAGPGYPSYSPSNASYSRPIYGDVAPPAAEARQGPLSLDPSQAAGGPNSPTYYPSVESAPLDPMPVDRYQRPYDAGAGSRDVIRGEPAPYRGASYPRDDRGDYSRAPRTTAPSPSPRLGAVPLGPPQRPIQTTAAVTPAATLACPIVSALDLWIRDSVQPAAQRWFNQPVVEIKQISAYSCRGMNGQPGAHISEHAFGNALDIAAFILADGRRITVKGGWRGAPEEQGFLRDVQAAACDQFTTVLAPGSNAYHYDHIHVDLMRRASGRRICEPGAVSGEMVAARAARNGMAYARPQDRYERAPRRDLIEPNNDPFAWRGGNRRDLPTGSISKRATAKLTPSRQSGPIDDEHILNED